MSKKSGLIAFLVNLNVEPFISQSLKSSQGEWVVERRQVPSLGNSHETNSYPSLIPVLSLAIPHPWIFPGAPEAI